MDNVFWATMAGSALGVIAGVGVQFLTQKLLDGNRDRRIREAIGTEARYNSLVLERIRKQLVEIRNAFNGNTLGTIYPFFPFGEALHIQVNNLAASGRLYEFLNSEQLARVQSLVLNMSVENARWFSDEFVKRKNSFLEDEASFDRNDFSNFLRFADGRVAELQQHLDRLADEFPNRRT